MQEQLSIIACGSYVPSEVKIDYDALELNEEEISYLGYTGVAIENKLFPVEMASMTLDQIFNSEKINKEDISYLCYTYIHQQGNSNFWSPASYLQNKHSLKNAIPFNLLQGCNSELLAIDLMCSVLNQQDKDKMALIASADRFSITKFNRYNSDYGIFYGDAASAIIIGKNPGIAKILAIQSISAPELEEMHRGPYQEELERNLNCFYDIRSTKKAYLEKYGRDTLMNLTRKSLTQLSKKVSAISNLQEIDYYIFPNLGTKLLEGNYYPAFPGAKEKSLIDFGKSKGHMGANDAIAGFDYLFKSKKLKRGQKLLLIGAGAGFTWSAMLLEME